MWQVINHTPFGANGTFVRDRHGREHWCVAVRARFDVISKTKVKIAEDQPRPRLFPEYDASAEELLAETDFSPFRPTPDVLLAGEVVPFMNRPVVRQELFLRLGGIEKRAVVNGRRWLEACYFRLVLHGPEPITRVRISWRNTYGGRASEHVKICEQNPIGAGNARGHFEVGTVIPVPSIEQVNHPYRAGRNSNKPCGFGPVQPSWPQRKVFAGTYDNHWKTNIAPLPPEDFSEKFFNSAPSDQIYPIQLAGGESGEIQGMNADGPFSFRLPQIMLKAQTKIGYESLPSRFRMNSVTLLPNRKQIEIVWNSSIQCQNREHLLKETTVRMTQWIGIA